MWNKFSSFFKEVIAELKKVSWPERRAMVESTSVVIMAVVFMTFFIGICDLVLTRMLGLFLK